MKKTCLLAIVSATMTLVAGAQNIIVAIDGGNEEATTDKIKNMGAPSGLGVTVQIALKQENCVLTTDRCCTPPPDCYEAWATSPSVIKKTYYYYYAKKVNSYTCGGQTGAINVNSQSDIKSHEQFRITIYQHAASTVSDYAASVWTQIISHCQRDQNTAKNNAKLLVD